jgi:hypothetical protein
VDYRTPNIYEPSTLTEPYAYARANPTMFWDPNGLYARSIHGYFTYFTALAVGLSEERAREIAYFAWGPDATKSLNAIGVIEQSLTPFPIAQKPSTIDTVRDVQRFHVIYPDAMEIGPRRAHGANALRTLNLPELDPLLQWETTHNSNGRKQRYIHRAQLSDDQKFGLISHYFQDSYAHTDTGMVDDPNPSYQKRILVPPPDLKSGYGLAGMEPNTTVDVPHRTFTSPFGHLHGSMKELGAEEDDPFLKPKIFMAMASQYFDLLSAYAQKTQGNTPRISKSQFLLLTAKLTKINSSSAKERDRLREDALEGIVNNKFGDHSLSNIKFDFLQEDGYFFDLLMLLQCAPSGRILDVDSRVVKEW